MSEAFIVLWLYGLGALVNISIHPHQIHSKKFRRRCSGHTRSFSREKTAVFSRVSLPNLFSKSARKLQLQLLQSQSSTSWTNLPYHLPLGSRKVQQTRNRTRTRVLKIKSTVFRECNVTIQHSDSQASSRTACDIKSTTKLRSTERYERHQKFIQANRSQKHYLRSVRKHIYPTLDRLAPTFYPTSQHIVAHTQRVRSMPASPKHIMPTK
jgi:hypothetical protein